MSHKKPQICLLPPSTIYTYLHSFIHLTDSGLEVRDRLWLKITIKNAFIGSDVVDWLYDKVSKGERGQ